jgi:hypothetical protein
MRRNQMRDPPHSPRGSAPVCGQAADNAHVPRYAEHCPVRGVVSGLVVAGLAEVAPGAVLGLPYALTVEGSESSRRRPTVLKVKHPRRARQAHLDLIIMGTLLTAAGAAVPGLPVAAVLAVAIGGWNNTLLFVPLIFDGERSQPGPSEPSPVPPSCLSALAGPGSPGIAAGQL